MTENPGRIRALLDDTLAGEPPLVDLIPAAVTGAEQNRRRGRVIAGGAAVAVLAVSVGAYGMAEHGHSGTAQPSALPPASSGSPATALYPPVHKSGFGIPGLFDDPGTPQEECAKVRGPILNTPEKQSQARDYCVRALTQLRALLPDDVVVLEPAVDFDQPSWSEPIAKTPDGGTPPGFVNAYQQAARNPAKVTYSMQDFAYHSVHGDGVVSYVTTPPGVKAQAEPGGDLPLGDGTSAHFSQEPVGGIKASGVTADGQWYELVVQGVYQVYGVGGGWLSPTFRGDGAAREIFPDGYVKAIKSNQRLSIPNPYGPAEVRTLITARGLGSLVKAIGANPVSLYTSPPPSAVSK